MAANIGADCGEKRTPNRGTRRLQRQRYPEWFVKSMSSPIHPPLKVNANGVLREAGSPLLALEDRAIASGVGVFETLSSYRGRILALDRHLARLHAGLTALGLSFEEPDWESAILELLLANRLAEAERARVRLTVTGGAPGGSPLWFIEATPLPPHEISARVITGPFVRNEHSLLRGCKTINYGDNEVAMRLAKEAGATEALFGNTAGRICEGTWSNVFIRHRGTWKTPTISSGCLPGVTREILLFLSANEGPRIAEADVPLSEIDGIESAFLTSSIREIQPVVSINDRKLTSPEDPQIAAWQEAFRAYVHS